MEEERPPEPNAIPHFWTIMAVTFFILGAFAILSAWVLVNSSDTTIQGSIIGTWTAMATSAGGFWLGSSSGGKSKK